MGVAFHDSGTMIRLPWSKLHFQMPGDMLARFYQSVRDSKMGIMTSDKFQEQSN